MAEEDTYIKLFRRIRDWEWYQDGNTFRVFVHLLLGANWEPKKWRGHIIGRGQVATGRRTLADELKLSERQIRTALTHLEDTGEITIQTGREFSIITLVNYDIPRGEIQQVPTHLTEGENPMVAGVSEREGILTDPPPTHLRPTQNDHQTTHQTTHLTEGENPMVAGVSGFESGESDPPIDPPKKSADLKKTTTTKEVKNIYIKNVSEKSKETGKKKKANSYSPEDKPYKACLWLIEQIKTIHPNIKTPAENTQSFQTWCDTLRKMNEYDPGRSWENFRRLVAFMRDNDFWSANLQSASGVRKNWDTAWAQYERTSRTQDHDDRWTKIVKAINRYGPSREAEALNFLGEELSREVKKTGYNKLCEADNINQYKGELLRACTQR